MAAGEDQTQAIIFDLLFIERSVVDARLHMRNKISLYSIEARAPSDHVNGFKACS
jgi:hypothetical protein